MIICVDVDGTLTKGVAWTSEECLAAIPNNELIERVNYLYQRNFIVIWTARRDNLIPATLEWLRRNNVRYHSISNLKCSGDLYIDDKAMRSESFTFLSYSVLDVFSRKKETELKNV